MNHIDKMDEKMSVEEWEEYLTKNPTHKLFFLDSWGEHLFQYDSDDEYVTLWLNGAAGYDAKGSRAGLEELVNRIHEKSFIGVRLKIPKEV